MDKVFINSLLEEMMKGNRPDGTFSTLAYNNVLDTLHNLFGSQITKKHLMNRKKTLSQRFGELYHIFNGLSGFSWNSGTKLFEAKSQIWNDLIKWNMGDLKPIKGTASSLGLKREATVADIKDHNCEKNVRRDEGISQSLERW